MFVFLYPYKFSQQAFKKFEIEELLKYTSVQIWDVSKIIYGKRSEEVHSDNFFKTHKKQITSLFLFRKKIQEVSDLNYEEDIIFLNYVEYNTLKGIILNKFLKNSGLKQVRFFNNGLPEFETPKRPFKEKLLSFLKKETTLFTAFHSFLMQPIYKYISEYLNLHADYFFVADRLKLNSLKRKHSKSNVKFIQGNSWDYSNYLNKSSLNIFPKELIDKEYILYIDGASPKPSDSNLFKSSTPLTALHWYPSVRKFFNEIEKQIGLPVVIAGHPLTASTDFTNEFGNRLIFHGITKELVKNSSLVISRGSTSCSFALIEKKKMILIYSDELKEKSPLILRNRIKTSQKMGVKDININRFESKSFEIPKIDYAKYENYIKSHLTLLDKPKTNSQILKNLIKN